MSWPTFRIQDRDIRQPFNEHPVCPACNGADVGYDYRTVEATRGIHADYFETTSLSDPQDPHLKVTCSTCGFWWMMEVARP